MEMDRPMSDSAIEELQGRLLAVVALARDLSRDELPPGVEPLTEPERDVWNACALLEASLRRYGIAIRDDFRHLLTPDATEVIRCCEHAAGVHTRAGCEACTCPAHTTAEPW